MYFFYKLHIHVFDWQSFIYQHEITYRLSDVLDQCKSKGTFNGYEVQMKILS